VVSQSCSNESPHSDIEGDRNEHRRLLVQQMVTRTLLVVTALVETGVGVTLLLSPPLVARLLLGASLDPSAASIVGRIAGAALVSLSAACWLARHDEPSRARRGLVAAMLLYNCAAAAVLAHAGAGLRLVGVLMWPAVALHAGLAVWCIASLRRYREASI
jgi:hypothetical protein